MPIAFSSPGIGLRAYSLVILLFLLKYADFVVHTCSQMLPIAPSVIAVKIFNDGMLGAVVRCLCACSETAGLESHSLRQIFNGLESVPAISHAVECQTSDF
jgi:hypothetical protein